MKIPDENCRIGPVACHLVRKTADEIAGTICFEVVGTVLPNYGVTPEMIEKAWEEYQNSCDPNSDDEPSEEGFVSKNQILCQSLPIFYCPNFKSR